MPTTSSAKERLPRAFEALVAAMPPQAIMDEAQYEDTLNMIDRLMAAGKLTKGQDLYFETLIQLVEAYEEVHYPIDDSSISGLDALRAIMADHDMNASDLARLLGVHPSMGSKILKGERSLTVGHLRKLAERFKVEPGLFL